MFDYLVTMHQFKLNLKLILNFFLDVSILYWHIILVNNYSLKELNYSLKFGQSDKFQYILSRKNSERLLKQTNHIKREVSETLT